MNVSETLDTPRRRNGRSSENPHPHYIGAGRWWGEHQENPRRHLHGNSPHSSSSFGSFAKVSLVIWFCRKPVRICNFFSGLCHCPVPPALWLLVTSKRSCALQRRGVWSSTSWGRSTLTRGLLVSRLREVLNAHFFLKNLIYPQSPHINTLND